MTNSHRILSGTFRKLAPCEWFNEIRKQAQRDTWTVSLSINASPRRLNAHQITVIEITSHQLFNATSNHFECFCFWSIFKSFTLKPRKLQYSRKLSHNLINEWVPEVKAYQPWPLWTLLLLRTLDKLELPSVAARNSKKTEKVFIFSRFASKRFQYRRGLGYNARIA